MSAITPLTTPQISSSVGSEEPAAGESPLLRFEFSETVTGRVVPADSNAVQRERYRRQKPLRR